MPSYPPYVMLLAFILGVLIILAVFVILYVFLLRVKEFIEVLETLSKTLLQLVIAPKTRAQNFNLAADLIVAITLLTIMPQVFENQPSVYPLLSIFIGLTIIFTCIFWVFRKS